MWFLGKRATSFFELKVFGPYASHLNKSLQQCHVMNEGEKKMILSQKRSTSRPHQIYNIGFLDLGNYGNEYATKLTPECQIYYQRNVIH